ADADRVLRAAGTVERVDLVQVRVAERAAQAQSVDAVEHQLARDRAEQDAGRARDLADVDPVRAPNRVGGRTEHLGVAVGLDELERGIVHAASRRLSQYRFRPAYDCQSGTADSYAVRSAASTSGAASATNSSSLAPRSTIAAQFRRRPRSSARCGA